MSGQQPPHPATAGIHRKHAGSGVRVLEQSTRETDDVGVQQPSSSRTSSGRTGALFARAGIPPDLSAFEVVDPEEFPTLPDNAMKDAGGGASGPGSASEAQG
jgi:hypothetical protein